MSTEQIKLDATTIEGIKALAVEAKGVEFHKVGNTEIMIDKEGNTTVMEEPVYTPDTLTQYSLDALVQAVKTEAVPRFTETPIYITVDSFELANCYTQPDASNKMKRVFLYTTKAMDVPGFRDCTWSFEQAMIALRARFQPTEDVSYMLNLLSHMSVDQSVQSDDNGVTQTVQVRQGVSFVANEAVRPIVTLAPYRTFQEVDQPASQFVFRVDEKRNVTLAEADGGMWKLEARRTVKQYLTDALADEIKAGRVIVTL